MEPSTESPECFGQGDNPTKQPPCAEWNIWTGFEIEGTEDLGTETLFIRNLQTDKGHVLSAQSVFTRALEKGVTRVWFCEGFYNLPVIAEAIERFEKVCWCLDVTDPRSQKYPLLFLPDQLKVIRFYLKVGDLFKFLRPGDFLCIGEKYADVAYQLPEGSGVTTELYEDDVRWH